MLRFVDYAGPSKTLLSQATTLHSGWSGGIDVTSINGDSRNAVDIMIPRIHRNAKEENAEGPAHINAIMDSEWWSEVGANFVKDFAPKEDRATV